MLSVAQFYFKYGAMNSGKSIEIIKVAHNYEEQNKPVELFTSAIDTRVDVGIVNSRAGFQRQATPITEDMDLFETIKDLTPKRYCILIDESQFLSNELFEGSKYLLLYADKIEEIKTICWFCHRKAIMNLRISDGKPVYEGEQIQIGGNESYYPVCRRCYKNPGLIK